MSEIRKPLTSTKALPPAARPDLDDAVQSIVEGGVLKSGSSQRLCTGPTREFSLRDINDDGVLTGNEIKGIEWKDANKDGKITREEFKSAARAEISDLVEMGRKAKFKKLDVNKDGVLTGAEAIGLNRLDKDGDGRVTEQEYLKGLAAEDRDKMDVAHDAEFRKLDINEDGVLTGTEARIAAALDADKDGKVTREEYLNGRAEGIIGPLTGHSAFGPRPTSPSPTALQSD
jgi:Ca2+-binding EF-hand superfamily protein